jgi:hypothetical protein
MKKENKNHPEKTERNKGQKESWKEHEKDRDLESGDNPDERRKMNGE